jgi:hypothetical protein
MTKHFVFVTNCTSAKGEDIRDMVDHKKQRDITRATFLEHVDYTEVLKDIETDLGYGRGWLMMAGDWAVSYSKSWYKGVPCYYFTWSAIEFIFVDEREIDSRGEIIPRPELQICWPCANNHVIPKWIGKITPAHDEDERQLIYICSNCKKQVFPKLQSSERIMRKL